MSTPETMAELLKESLRFVDPFYDGAKIFIAKAEAALELHNAAVDQMMALCSEIEGEQQ